MDETSVNFENPASTTISRKGENTVSLATTGHEKKCVTVLLTASSDGKKRKPLVIFKGKGATKEDKALKLRQDVFIFYTENGWVNDSVMSFWIQMIFNDFESMFNRLLIWDSFRAHISQDTKKILKKKKIDTAVIPGGCTGLIQVLFYSL